MNAQHALAATFMYLCALAALGLVLHWWKRWIQDRRRHDARRLAAAKRTRLLIAHAKEQHQAVMRGDLFAGVYGQYPPVDLEPPLPELPIPCTVDDSDTHCLCLGCVEERQAVARRERRERMAARAMRPDLRAGLHH